MLSTSRITFLKTLKSIKKHNGRRFMRHLVEKYIQDTPHRELINFDNLESVQRNIELRKSNISVECIQSVLDKLERNSLDDSCRIPLLQELKDMVWQLPNETHPDVAFYGDNPKTLDIFNALPKFTFTPKSFEELARVLNLLRMEHLGNFTGHKSYYLLNALAEMETALVRYTLDNLRKINFELISVPDVLPEEIIKGCGMQTDGERTQVYKLTPSGNCLSGTSEMALAGYFSKKTLKQKDLPLKLAAVSRCFRAETSGLQEERGIYRVHQFTKVEMFAVCTEQQSDSMLNMFKEIQVSLFNPLGLHFKLLDMPPYELGAPAYRKYDIEAWMPGREMWGEISSCSNCTDYQAKRLNIKYGDGDNLQYVHTVNGTACAVPRMLIALLETHQRNNGTIEIPRCLQSFMRNQTEIVKRKDLPQLKLVKSIDWPSDVSLKCS